MRAAILVAMGGAVGAVLRHGLSRSAVAFMGEGFPGGTLAVNVLGSFLLGLIYTASSKQQIPPDLQVLLGTGFCGALTTFSTFSVESLTLIQEGSWGWALANVTLNVVLGFAAAALGMAVLR